MRLPHVPKVSIQRGMDSIPKIASFLLSDYIDAKMQSALGVVSLIRGKDRSKMYVGGLEL